MKRWERVWIVEYRAYSGDWYPEGNQFYDYKRHALDKIAELRLFDDQHGSEGKYRAVLYLRKA